MSNMTTEVNISQENIVKCLDKAVLVVLTNISDDEVTVADPDSLAFFKNADCRAAGIILSGDILVHVRLITPVMLARLLASRLGKCPPDNLNDDDISEGVAEIANQLAGRLRMLLWGQQCKTKMSLPGGDDPLAPDGTKRQALPPVNRFFTCMENLLLVQLVLFG